MADSSSSVFSFRAAHCAVLLGKALEASSFSVQEKAAWNVLIPEMRLDQLVRFAIILDGALKQSAEKSLAPLFRSIQSTLDKHAAIQAELDHTFMTDISHMVQEFRRAETLAQPSL